MPEFLSFDVPGNIGVGGAEQTHVDPDFLGAAQTSETAILQHAQQLGLQLRRHFRDFIQQQRPAIRQLESYRAGRSRRR